jgi:DNA polymerase III subunit chi
MRLSTQAKCRSDSCDASVTTSAAPAEVLFYHLDTQPLEKVLPGLVERTLARGWRAVVQVGSDERVEAIDQLLWTYADDSFLPHGTAKAGKSDEQPVYLTTGDETPNAAGVRFLVDGATTTLYTGIERLVFMFDGNDEEAVQSARRSWKSAKAAGCAVTYWQQSPDGRWMKKA